MGQYELLQHDEGLRRMLKNESFRKMIVHIDDSVRPQQRLEAVMRENAEFAEFVDYMLRVIGFRTGEKKKESQIDECADKELDFDEMDDVEQFKVLVRTMIGA